MPVSIKCWLKLYFVFLFFFNLESYLQAEISEFTSAFGESTQMVKNKHQQCNRPFSVKKEGRQILQKNYHHLKVCHIEGCFKVTKNLGEHFCSKTHKLKPGPDYYQLLQSAKTYFPMTPR